MIGLSVLVFIVVLGVLVIVHEIGHFVAARIFKVGVDEFGVGFPPRLTSFRRGQTTYSLNWIPIGGFVKIKGVVGGDQIDSPVSEPVSTPQAASFSDKPIWQRFAILCAGIFMNLVLAIGLFSIGYSIGMPAALYDVPESATISDRKVVIVDFSPQASAGQAGLQVGDTIRSIDTMPVNKADDLRGIFKDDQSNTTVDVTVERGGDTTVVQQVKTIELETGVYGLGAYFVETGTVQLPLWQAVPYATTQTITLTQTIILSLVDVVAGIFTTADVSSNLAGPLGIASLTHEVTQLGFVYVLQFAAILSINLAIFNLLPFPALDGGRLAFLLFEVIACRPVNRRVEAIIHNIGFILLLLIIIAVTIKDAFSFF